MRGAYGPVPFPLAIPPGGADAELRAAAEALVKKLRLPVGWRDCGEELQRLEQLLKEPR